MAEYGTAAYGEGLYVGLVVVTRAERPPTTVTVDGRPLRSIEGLTFSNVDPGGCQTLSVHAPGDMVVGAGADIAVHHGLAWAWQGRANAQGPRDRARKHDRAIEAVGRGAALGDDPTFTTVYVDRDLGRWRVPSTDARIGYVTNNKSTHDHVTRSDIDNAKPALETGIAGAWVSPLTPICDAWYDAGPGINVGSIYYAWERLSNVDGSNTAYEWRIVSTALDTYDGGANSDTGNLRSTSTAGSGTFTAGRRYLRARFAYNTTPAGADGGRWAILWTSLVVFGDHDLATRGTPPAYGLYPQDIARHAVEALALPWDIQVDAQTDYIAPHAVYPTPGAHEQVVADMAGLLGWHWGTWPPDSILDSEPVFVFAKPPENVTVTLHRRDCDSFEAPQLRLDRLFNVCQVTYRDAAGTPGLVTVTQSNPLLDQAGIDKRTLTIDMGVGSAASATDLANLALALAVANARGGGSASLRGDVRLAGGGHKPACLLRAGRDRIQIPDLLDAGPLTGAAGQRGDIFLVRRVESSLQADGSLATRIEFDQGADLLEVLQARLAIAAQVA